MVTRSTSTPRNRTRTKSGKTTRKKVAVRSSAAASKSRNKKATRRKATGTKTTKSSRTPSRSKKAAAPKTVRKKAGSKKKTTSSRTKTTKRLAPNKKPTAKKKGGNRGMTAKKTRSKSGKKTQVTSAKGSSARKAASATDSPTQKNAAHAAAEKAAGNRKRPRSVAEAASSVKADEKGYVFINGRRVRMISTQGLPATKKTRAATAEIAPEEQEPSKPTKTRLSRKELTHYRNLLLIKRAEIVGDLSAMEAAALRSSGGNLSHMPIHMADIGSDTYDQDFTLGLAENERQQIREIDEALQRIEEKTYGVCVLTGEHIPKARLDAKPWAKYTIEAARLMEGRSQR